MERHGTNGYVRVRICDLSVKVKHSAPLKTMLRSLKSVPRQRTSGTSTVLANEPFKQKTAAFIPTN